MGSHSSNSCDGILFLRSSTGLLEQVIKEPREDVSTSTNFCSLQVWLMQIWVCCRGEMKRCSSWWLYSDALNFVEFVSNWNLGNKNIMIEISHLWFRGVYMFVSRHPQCDPLFFQESIVKITIISPPSKGDIMFCFTFCKHRTVTNPKTSRFVALHLW